MPEAGKSSGSHRPGMPVSGTVPSTGSGGWDPGKEKPRYADGDGGHGDRPGAGIYGGRGRTSCDRDDARP